MVLLTPEQAGKRVGLCTPIVQRHIHSGDLPAFKIKGTRRPYLIDQDQLDQWNQARRDRISTIRANAARKGGIHKLTKRRNDIVLLACAMLTLHDGNINDLLAEMMEAQ
jgi:excisionase family DNA binding protein